MKRNAQDSGVDLLGLIASQPMDIPSTYGYGNAPARKQAKLLAKVPALAAVKGKTRKWLIWLDQRR